MTGMDDDPSAAPEVRPARRPPRAVRASVVERALDGLLNAVRQPLGVDARSRLRAALLRPGPQTWDRAFRLCISGIGVTVWQAVLHLDPTCPRSLPDGDLDDPARWGGYYPDPFTLLAALRSVTHGWACVQCGADNRADQPRCASCGCAQP